jgi:hypothetical protein
MEHDMKFNLGDGSQSAAGIGSIFKTLMQAPILREQMEQKAGLINAQTYAANKHGDKYGAEADGLNYTLSKRRGVNDQIASDPAMPAYVQMALKAFDMTGDNNMERFAKASGEYQTQGIRDTAVKNVGDVDLMNRFNTLAKPGETYEPFDNIGNTGRGFNKATGFGKIIDSVLATGFDKKVNSEINENNAQAGNAGASAKLTQEKLRFLQEKGALPGSGAEGAEGALSSTILNTIKVPALDAKGRPVVNPLTGEQQTKIDPDAQRKFYQWAQASGRRPTAAAFAKWESQGRPGGGTEAVLNDVASRAPGGNKNAGAAPVASTMAIEKARAAIAKGAPRDAVIKRLKDNGIDPTGL